jgi:NADH-quinone oxidoreductase subunit L
MSATSNVLGLPILFWIALLPLLGALINLTIGRKMSRGFVHFIAVAAVAASFGLSLWVVIDPLIDQFRAWKQTGTGVVGFKQVAYTWIEVGGFKAELAFRLDTLSAVMILIVTFVGALIHLYSTGYMAHDDRPAAYFGYLNLFTGSMLILVLGANLPVMFIGWEGVGLCSFLLIGFWFKNDAFATAGRKAFVVNRIGDFCFLLGMFLLYWATKDMALPGDASGVVPPSLDFARLSSPEAQAIYVKSFWSGERLAAAAGILLFIGACGKSAQFPLYTWLPDAMAGPTPVSALIHAATMVTAGVYMVVRMSFLYASSTTALAVVATIGVLTALLAAFYAIAQTDLKKVLAYSTVSQLGFMFVAAGTGNWVAAIFHLGTHAFFKAGLFLGAGSVMHGMEAGGSKTPGDIMTMGGLAKKMKLTHLCFFLYCLSIAGFPVITAGFYSKDEILAGAFGVTPPGWPVVYGKILWGLLMVAAFGTAFYMWRLYFLVFAGKPRSEAAEHAHESPWTMTGPLVVLAVFSIVAGFVGMPHLEKLHLPGVFHGVETWLSPSVAHSWYPEGGAIKPHLGDGTTLALMAGASLVAILGIGVAWALYGRGPSARVERLTAEGAPLAPLYQASKHKLWVDEFYDRVLVRPFKAIARGSFEILDRFVIDTVVVNGSALAVSMFGRIARWLQNGQVQRYLLGVVVGAALVFAVTAYRFRPGFSYREVGEHIVELRAEPGEGIAGANCKLAWDFESDGTIDEVVPPGERVIQVTDGRVSGATTLTMDCPYGGKTTVSRVMKLSGDPATAQQEWR